MKLGMLMLMVLMGIHYAGTWVDTTFTTPSLGFPNQVRIYLPDGYDPQGSVDYPTIYWLHGWSVSGAPGQSTYSVHTMTALDSLIRSGQISPVILIKPNGSCQPYGGSMWANSELYGSYEDYITYDLVEFMEENFCVCSEPWKRSIAGHSMGAGGSMDIALRHPDRYQAVASHAGPMDYSLVTDYLIPVVLSESPETEPPYTYSWGNGFYTQFLFMTAGAFSPNLSAPDSVDFLLDANGELVDSVYALYNLHNPSHMVKLFSTQPDLGIFIDCGDQDDIVGMYESNCNYADTLASLGISHTFQDLPGVGHGMNLSRFIEELLFLDQQMTGIVTETSGSHLALNDASPNPFSVFTTLTFCLPTSGSVRLDIYDLSGRLIETLLDGTMVAGNHTCVFDGGSLSPGVYLAQLRSSSQASVKRMVLVR